MVFLKFPRRNALVVKMLAGYLLLVLLPTLFVGGQYVVKTREGYERMHRNDRISALQTACASVEHNLRMLEENYQFVQNHANFIAFLSQESVTVVEQLEQYLLYYRWLFNYLRYSSSYISDVSVLTDRRGVVEMSQILHYDPDWANHITRSDWSGLWTLATGEDGTSELAYRRVLFEPITFKPIALLGFHCKSALLEEALAGVEACPLLRIDGALYRLREGVLTATDEEAGDCVPIEGLGIEVCLSAQSAWQDSLYTRQSVYTLLSAILCVLSTAFYFFMVIRLSRRIRRFANHIAINDTPRPFEDDRPDELGKLASAYNDMLHNNIEMRRQVELEQMRNREAAYLALQAQINPHFIYNTLENARMCAEMGETQSTIDILCALGGRLRYATTSDDGRVCVRDEIDNACKYLFMQQFRMEDRLLCDIDAQNEALDCGCLKFILQPLVENAVKYGIAPKPDGGSVALTARTKEGWCTLCVADDGCGVTSERLEEIWRGLEKPKIARAGGGIGLSNIYGRMRYIYGDEGFRMTLDSSPGNGFRATITWKEAMRRCD